MKNFKFLSTIIAATLLLVACEAEELNLADDTPQNVTYQENPENPNPDPIPTPTDGEDDMPGQDGNLILDDQTSDQEDETDGEDDMPGQDGDFTDGEDDMPGQGGNFTDGEDDMPGQG
ncbi:MAG: hypothetical protein Aureis2KO_31650 [Aureisphaera sp.]